MPPSPSMRIRDAIIRQLNALILHLSRMGFVINQKLQVASGRLSWDPDKCICCRLCSTTVNALTMMQPLGFMAAALPVVPLGLQHMSRLQRCFHFTTENNNERVPALCNRTSGFKTASSSLRCRQSSSSYSEIVLSNSSNISSAAAVSRWLTNALSSRTLDIFFSNQQLFLQTHSFINSLVTQMCAVMLYQITSAPVYFQLASQVNFISFVGHQEIIWKLNIF